MTVERTDQNLLRESPDDTPLPTSFPALSDKTFTLPYSPISPQTHTPEQTSISSDKALPPTYPVVALGGECSTPVELAVT